MEYSGLTMLCSFQGYSKAIPLYIHVYLFFFKFFSQLGCYRILSSIRCSSGENPVLCDAITSFQKGAERNRQSPGEMPLEENVKKQRQHPSTRLSTRGLWAPPGQDASLPSLLPSAENSLPLPLRVPTELSQRVLWVFEIRTCRSTLGFRSASAFTFLCFIHWGGWKTWLSFKVSSPAPWSSPGHYRGLCSTTFNSCRETLQKTKTQLHDVGQTSAVFNQETSRQRRPGGDLEGAGWVLRWSMVMDSCGWTVLLQGPCWKAMDCSLTMVCGGQGPVLSQSALSSLSSVRLDWVVTLWGMAFVLSDRISIVKVFNRLKQSNWTRWNLIEINVKFWMQKQYPKILSVNEYQMLELPLCSHGIETKKDKILGCIIGLPKWRESKEPPANQSRRHQRSGFHPRDGKIPWRGKWYRTSVFFLGESHGQRSQAGYSAGGHKESDTTECLST